MEKASSSLKEADSGVWVHVSLSYKDYLWVMEQLAGLRL
jgi:hypothetical protein